MTIKLREDGVYLTREGEKVGPLSRHEDDPICNGIYNWTDGVLFWTESGRVFEDRGHKYDIVSEVTEPPSPAMAEEEK